MGANAVDTSGRATRLRKRHRLPYGRGSESALGVYSPLPNRDREEPVLQRFSRRDRGAEPSELESNLEPGLLVLVSSGCHFTKSIASNYHRGILSVVRPGEDSRR